jgi:hypothetical protein
MTDEGREAETTLRRFRRPIQWAARQAAESFPSITEYEDAVQDASVLVLSYAGHGDGGVRFGKMDAMEAYVDRDEGRLQNLVAEQLRRDLKESYGRQAAKQLSTVSVDALPENRHPLVSYENGMVERMDKQRELMQEYPYLCRIYLRGETEQRIAEADDTPYRTVKYRVAAEKQKALKDPNITHLSEIAGWESGWTPGEPDDAPSVCTCGTQFLVGGTRAVEHACSLGCWQQASTKRRDTERRYWATGSGYHDGHGNKFDPTEEFPYLYEYKGWK